MGASKENFFHFAYKKIGLFSKKVSYKVSLCENFQRQSSKAFTDMVMVMAFIKVMVSRNQHNEAEYTNPPRKLWVTPETLALIDEKRSCPRESERYRQRQTHTLERHMCMEKWKSIRRAPACLLKCTG